ncbi:hypothetical protein [Ureibacillus chungkukjangi]|uniref:Uncharacterized protein n=1 Tax=Ureibacillus chungkukjangi TaxID=1202712 RepID=A0A318TPB2_9BACL|nr:hypothetical protein [Ureibacillus chungkukjangi]MCM3388718.1 hypothetical protein [Ureibacillus chungkukjangi]PYF06626.1 hypothetical protein BJ095_10847 [Ureibacillus chungkukjangi]
MDIIEENAIPAFLESTQLIVELESVDVYNNIIFPVQAKEYDINPQVEVPYDLKKEETAQKSVDEGHSPWRIDPVLTTQVFVSLQLSPKGIEGEYPIEEGNIKLLHSTKDTAVVEVNDTDTIIKFVYLKRLVNQDASGIWTVIGYDKIDK